MIDANAIDLTHMLAPPSALHPLGTDSLGRDLLARIAAAVQETVLPLWTFSALATLGGILLGLALMHAPLPPFMARTLRVLMRLVAGFPAVVLVFGLSIALGTGFWAVALGLCIFFALRAGEAVENLWIADKNLGFWVAHTALGGTPLGRVWRYGILGSWRDRLTQLLCFHLRIALIVEASLSYLGFGIQEPDSSFGNLISAHFNLLLRGDARVCLTIIAAFWICTVLPTLGMKLNVVRLRQKRNNT